MYVYIYVYICIYIYMVKNTTSSEDFCQLVKFILENNVFSFNDEYFLQVCGTAMGT